MTVGIYYLKFNTNMYIGQSDNIERRIKDHIRLLLTGKHTNNKICKMYLSYGLPEYGIVEVCDIPSLNDKEIYWIKELDTFFNGLNNNEGGDSFKRGNAHINSKYSKDKIIEVFEILLKNDMSANNISKITGVSQQTIEQIAGLRVHTWLKEEFPDKYLELINLKNTRKRSGKTSQERGIVYPLVKSPEGVSYSITNTAEFSRLFNLDPPTLRRLLHGTVKQHKGWTLA